MARERIEQITPYQNSDYKVFEDKKIKLKNGLIEKKPIDLNKAH